MAIPGSTGNLISCKREEGAVSWRLQAKIKEIERFLACKRKKSGDFSLSYSFVSVQMPDHVWHDGEGVAGVTADIGLDRLVFCAPSAEYTLYADYRPDGSSSSPEGLSFRPAIAPVTNRTA